MDMDTEDSTFEPSDRNSDVSHDEATERTLANDQVERIAAPRSSPLKVDQLASGKWESLKANYIPAYRELFQEADRQADGATQDEGFGESQLGAVTWTSQEKTRFFCALDRRGRHDLRELATAIGTKSEIEVKAYLDAIRQSESDRQLYYRQTRNISHAEIPAAIEIGGELEHVLNEAAAALAAHQERYDYASQGNRPDYIINEEIAKQIDASNDATEIDEPNDEPVQTEHQLFRMTNFIGLSTKLFMVGSSQSVQRQRDPDDWYSLAHGEETPSMTQDTVSDFENLVVSFVQRVIQSSIFLAESRIRATTNSRWLPLRDLRKEDIWAALDVVGSSRNSREFWLGWPKRSGVKVWSGSHRKGNSSKKYIDHDTAREMLSQPAYRGRHSRSTSQASTSNMSDDSIGSTSSGSREGRQDDQPESDSSDSIDGAKFDDPDSASGDDHSISSLSTLSDEERAESDDNEQEEAQQPSKAMKLLPGQRKRRLEHDLKHHMEVVDAAQSRQEEDSIKQLLDIHDDVVIKEESDAEPPRKRPKVLRKTIEEVKGWQGPPVADWEAYEMPIVFAKESAENNEQAGGAQT